MKKYKDFIAELNSGKIRQCYYVCTNGSYLVNKASGLLRNKICRSPSSNIFFIKYADEISLDELREFVSESPSLFDPVKLVLIRRCEKYSRKLESFFEFSESVEGNSYLICVFEEEFVKEKKLYKRTDFYDFSVITGEDGISLVKDEFKLRGISLDDSVAELLIDAFHSKADFIISEISKISDYLSEGGILTRDILINILKFNIESSFDELFFSLIKQDRTTAIKAAKNILEHQGISEVYLLVVLSMMYSDLILFRKSGKAPYGFWGDRAQMLRECAKLVSDSRLKLSFAAIVEIDKMLKNTMTDPKVLILNLIGTLILIND